MGLIMTAVDSLRRKLYSVGRSYLISQLPPSTATEILNQHVGLKDGSKTSASINEIYAGILFSAQNVREKKNTISGAISGFDNLSIITDDFSPQYVLDTYANAHSVFSKVMKTLKPTGNINQATNGTWPKYCRTIYTAAQFMARFSDGDDFYTWANRMYEDERCMDALPLLLEHEIHGVGYALACDFLKEKGFIHYGKPDTHVINILSKVGLCPENADMRTFQNEIREIARVTGESAYHVDKILWLLGSGDFYMVEPRIKLSGTPRAKFYLHWDSLK